MDSVTNTSVGGNVDSGGDFVGRDKIIFNIVTVGRFLEFAQAQNLLPEINGQAAFENIYEAIEGIFDDGLNNDLAEATAFAGEILRDVLTEWLSLQTGVHISLKELILGLPSKMYEQLKLSGYWDIYSQVINYEDINIFPLIDRSSFHTSLMGQILFLTATDALWEERLNVNIPGYCALIYLDGFETQFVIVKHESGRRRPTPFKADIVRWSTLQQRLFLVGVVFDLIRIHSENRLNLQFLRALISSLEVPSNKEKTW